MKQGKNAVSQACGKSVLIYSAEQVCSQTLNLLPSGSFFFDKLIWQRYDKKSRR